MEKSNKKDKGIKILTFRQYSNLPEIVGNRLFKVMDEDQNDLVEYKEFIHTMFKIYCSKLESKIKLVFDIYDFDFDGIVKKEDIRIIMSHIPLNKDN
mmetsp:Transcript_29481/g.28638  ORF Transcript_29481/g.28638 Transcript_29481/m.28638 type:complete len:97 (+) Transcript_29481:203-493(+)